MRDPTTRGALSSEPESPVSRVVLVGFMGAGKTAVGQLLAARLGWEHVDLDAEIERREGRRVAEIFADRGEAYFRRLEAEATDGIAARTGVVVSPGGGWITSPGVLDRVGRGTLVAWLRVSPEEADRRAAAAPGERPLLAGPDPLGAARRLLETREPLYRRAHLAVETDGRTAGEVAGEIERVVRARGVNS